MTFGYYCHRVQTSAPISYCTLPDILLDHVTLERGVTYYTTVEACNGAGLCVTVTSDGVIADTSPPVVGVIYDGISFDDIDYQSSR